MSAELLREAAAKMRERAEAATPGPWLAHDDDEIATVSVLIGLNDAGIPRDICWQEMGGPAGMRNAEHIASWHPAVALAVADWLEAKAEQDDKGHCDDPRGCCNLCEHDYGNVAALAVARAYLGRES